MPHRRAHARALGLLLLPFLAQAQRDLVVDHSTLPNGLNLLLHTDHKAPIVHLNIRVPAGSKHEPAGKLGIAHLTEHLFFQSAESVAFLVPLAEIGATNGCGDLNEDFTEYCETVPASRLERLLWLESNRFAQFLPLNLTAKNLASQREVVINERRLKVENDEYARVQPALRASAFPAGHPYNHDPGGEYADLRSVTLDDVRDFYSAHYTADQISLAIVGDFDPAQVKQWVAKYFGPLAPADFTAAPPSSAPPLTAPKLVQSFERVRNPRAYFAWIGPPADSRDAAALDFTAFMLNDDYSPRMLHHALGDALSQGVTIGQELFQDASLFYPYVTLAPGSSISAIEAKTVSEFGRLARDGPTTAEITRTRDHLESSLAGDLESIRGLAYAIQQVHHFYGGIDHWTGWFTRYASITSDDIRGAVNRWLVTPSHLTIDVRPLTAVRPDVPEPNRTTSPPFQPEKPFHVPAIQSAKLPNGLEIFLLERHDLPKVAFRIQFRAGAFPTLPGKPLVAALAAAALGKGNKTDDGIDVERALADLGASLAGDAGIDTQNFRFSVLRKNLEPTLRIAAHVFFHPAYPDWAIDERKKEWTQEIEQPQTNLENYTRELFAAAFGPNNPFSRTMGTAASIRTLSAADAHSFHDLYWRPNVAALVFAGDITLKDAIALATESFGDWTGAAPPVPAPPPAAPAHSRIVYVDRKGLTQTLVVQALPAVPREHPDYPALYLADLVYGGLASNRISNNIRQQHGIAYYARSELITLPGAGLWQIYSAVQQDSTALAIREFDQELAAFGRSKPITAAELDAARAVVTRTLPEEFETLDSAAGAIAYNWSEGRPLSGLEDFPASLAAVTLDQVNTAARKYAQPGQAFFLLVGDRAKIEPQLREIH